MTLGERIIELRNSKNVSRKELADFLNLGYTAIAKYETNVRIPDKDTLAGIGDFFDVSVDYIIGRTDIKKFEATYPEHVINIEGLSVEDAEIVRGIVKRLSSNV